MRNRRDQDLLDLQEQLKPDDKTQGGRVAQVSALRVGQCMAVLFASPVLSHHIRHCVWTTCIV